MSGGVLSVFKSFECHFLDEIWNRHLQLLQSHVIRNRNLVQRIVVVPIICKCFRDIKQSDDIWISDSLSLDALDRISVNGVGIVDRNRLRLLDQSRNLRISFSLSFFSFR